MVSQKGIHNKILFLIFAIDIGLYLKTAKFLIFAVELKIYLKIDNILMTL